MRVTWTSHHLLVSRLKRLQPLPLFERRGAPPTRELVQIRDEVGLLGESLMDFEFEDDFGATLVGGVMAQLQPQRRILERYPYIIGVKPLPFLPDNVPARASDIFKPKHCVTADSFDVLRRLVLSANTRAPALRQCIFLDQCVGKGEHAVTNADWLSSHPTRADPAAAAAEHLRHLRGAFDVPLDEPLSLVFVDVGAGGFFASVSDAGGDFHTIEVDKDVRRHLLSDDRRRERRTLASLVTDSLAKNARRDNYRHTLVRLLARQHTQAARVLIVLGRNFLVGMTDIAWSLVQLPGVAVALIDECGSSKCCSYHLAKLLDVVRQQQVFICSEARDALLALKATDDPAVAKSASGEGEAESHIIVSPAFDAAHQHGRMLVVPVGAPCRHATLAPVPVALSQSQPTPTQGPQDRDGRTLGVTLGELNASVPILPRDFDAVAAVGGVNDERRQCGAQFADKVYGDKRMRLFRWFGAELGLQLAPDAVGRGEFLLNTSPSATDVLRAVNRFSGTRQIDDLATYRSDFVVNQLKVEPGESGVDVIKLLRSRQVQLPAYMFSNTELQHKKDRWLKRRRCSQCPRKAARHSQRCDDCRASRLAHGKVKMACAGLGLCNCKKGHVPVDKLRHVWAIEHWHTVWRQKRCEAVAGEEHVCHRDQSATFAFMLMLRVEAEHGGRVEAHCHSTSTRRRLRAGGASVEAVSVPAPHQDSNPEAAMVRSDHH